ncbi:hypothetical protein GA0115246_109791, partial [Streptomyces sp. SolWspMP-sol7th]
MRASEKRTAVPSDMPMTTSSAHSPLPHPGDSLPLAVAV